MITEPRPVFVTVVSKNLLVWTNVACGSKVELTVDVFPSGVFNGFVKGIVHEARQTQDTVDKGVKCINVLGVVVGVNSWGSYCVKERQTTIIGDLTPACGCADATLVLGHFL